MRHIKALALTIAIAGSALACGTPAGDPDAAAGGGDALAVADGATGNVDAPGGDIDASTQPATRPSSLVQTSGGGAAESTSYRLQLRIGAPQPAGTTSSAGHTARLGPGATR